MHTLRDRAAGWCAARHHREPPPFTSLLRHGIRVLVSAELSAEIGLTRYRPPAEPEA